MSHRLRSHNYAGLLLVIAGLLIVLSGCALGGDPEDGGSGSTTSTEPLPPPETRDVNAIEAPTAPSGVRVADTRDGRIELTWEASRDQSVTGYQLTRVDPTGGVERFDLSEPGFIDDGLEDGDILSYRIAAVSEAGVGETSETITARVGEDTSPPTAPGRPRTVEGGDATVSLAWTMARDMSGIAGYEIIRTIDGTEEILATVENTLLDDPPAGIIATYQVRAIDNQGNVSELGRSTTLLTGSTVDRVVVVVSAVADPASTPETERLRAGLLEDGFAVSWFEDDQFDANITRSEDVVLLLGDVEGQGFDWNIFLTDSAVIGFKSMFMEASGLTENPPKFDRLAQLTYLEPDAASRTVELTTTPKPKPVAHIPANEQATALQVWGRPVWSDSIAVMGLIPKGESLANDKKAPGCRAFFPGNLDSLSEQTNAAWDLLFDFVDGVEQAC